MNCNACSSTRNSSLPGNDRSMTRRRIISIPAMLPALTLFPIKPVLASALVTNKEVANESSPLIQEMLKRTEEKREERKAERLADYYRRNFGDYFSFEAGSNMDRKGLSPETQAKNKRWLEENGDGQKKEPK